MFPILDKAKKGNCCKIVQRLFDLARLDLWRYPWPPPLHLIPNLFFLFRETGEAPFSGRQWHGSWDKSVFCVGIPIVSSFFVTKYPPSLLSGFQFCQTIGGWAGGGGDLRLQVFFEFRKTIKKNYRSPLSLRSLWRPVLAGSIPCLPFGKREH